MDLLQKFREYINREDLFHPKDKLLIAVSGGVDSVVLVELCSRGGYDFAIAHCNFQLRGEECERDEAFVKTLAEKYKVELLIKKMDTEKYAAENKCSIQVAARELRYSWFSELLKSPDYNFKFLCTAHHADDNIETLLLNFFKGTGITGLTGIMPKQNKIIRPLLFARKEELVSFAADNQLSAVEDSSNASDKYTRNYFRNQLIPALKQVFPQVENNLINNIRRFNDIEILYQDSVNRYKKKLLVQKENELHIPVLLLKKMHASTTIIYEIIKDFGFTPHQAPEVIDLLNAETGRYISSSTHRIIKNRNWLIISPNTSTEAANIIIEENTNIILFEGGKLEIKKLPATQPSTDSSTAYLDAAKIKFPLLLRKCKKGDYFYPLGMNKKKKISRFFIDQKLSLSQKEKTWVIEMDAKIIWVVGMRIDDRCKLTDNTKDILQIKLIVKI